MQELRHAELSEPQLEYIHRTVPDQKRLLTATSLFVIDDSGVPLAYRLAERFNNGVPETWGKPLLLANGQPLAVPAKEKKAPARIVKASELLPAPVENGVTKVKRDKLFPCPLNPRKTFDQDYLNGLAETLVSEGFLNDLIGRRRPGGAADEFEIVAGECRWRASEIAGLDEIPVKVKDLSDAQVLKLMLVENMKRKDLTTIEESDAFNLALAQMNADGTPVYATLEAFAKQIGEKPSYVKQRRNLRKLPESGRTALGCGDISFKTARVICSVPESLITKVIDVVLHPGKYNVWTDGEKRCLTADEAQKYVREHVVRELRDTPFQQNDAKLLPVELDTQGQRVQGGACTDCPWNSAIQASEDGETSGNPNGGRPRGESKWCQNPNCFAKKVEIHTAAALVKAKEGGCEILSAEQSAKILYDDGTVKDGAAYVRLDHKPEHGERNEKIEEKSLPTWSKIVNGEVTAKVVTGHDAEGEAQREEVSGEIEVPTVAAVTARGHVVKLVKRDVAITAAQKRGTAHFLSLSSGGGKSLMMDEVADRQRKERAEQKLRNEVSFAATAALVTVIEESDEMIYSELYLWLVKMAMWHGSNDAQQFVVKRRGLQGKDIGKELMALAKRGSILQRLALALELLVARPLKFTGVGDEHFKHLADIYKLDVGKIDKAIRAGEAEQQKEKKKKEKAAKAKHPAGKIIKALKGKKAK